MTTRPFDDWVCNNCIKNLKKRQLIILWICYMFPSCPSPDPVNEKQDFWKMALIIETIGNLIKRGYMLLEEIILKKGTWL